MYEEYTQQALPEKQYRELLGSALCVFNSNNSFIIETVLRHSNSYSWYSLIDLESGKLKKVVRDAISKEYGDDIEKLFSDIIEQRNRIVHSFQITNKQNKQVLATKVYHESEQFEITEEYLLNFIKLNEKLSDMLHDLRGN
ncbi:selenium binding protein [Desulfovibrio piger]|uniref:Selenium binding protein n=1 Tax=Desulfovibrio piger TaxID=901 RepID=A0A848CD71_9BACT|nr:selenium binding protein [Desulfovibrio piger]NME53250.1 selenium binding protein [Desulfovibrio piger]